MKDSYPPGTRIILLNMDDPYAPVPEGTKGTVVQMPDIDGEQFYEVDDDEDAED